MPKVFSMCDFLCTFFFHVGLFSVCVFSVRECVRFYVYTVFSMRFFDVRTLLPNLVRLSNVSNIRKLGIKIGDQHRNTISLKFVIILLEHINNQKQLLTQNEKNRTINPIKNILQKIRESSFISNFFFIKLRQYTRT